MYDCVAEERRPNQLLLTPAGRGVPPKNAPTGISCIECKRRPPNRVDGRQFSG